MSLDLGLALALFKTQPQIQKLIESELSEFQSGNSIYANTYYANDNDVDVQEAIDQAIAESGDGTARSQHVNMSPGSFGGTEDVALTGIENFAVTGQPTNPSSPHTEVGSGNSPRNFNISGADSTRVKMANFIIQGDLNIDGTLGRHSLYNMTVNGSVNFTNGTQNFMLYYDSTIGGMSTDAGFAGLVYLIRCDLSGGDYTNLLHASETQVILLDCTGVPADITNVTFAGQTFFADGTVRVDSSNYYVDGAKFGVTHLDDTDLDTTGPVDYNSLVYDADSGQWVPDMVGLQPEAQSITGASGTVSLDLDRYNWFNITPTQNVEVEFDLGDQAEAKFDLLFDNVDYEQDTVADATYDSASVNVSTEAAKDPGADSIDVDPFHITEDGTKLYVLDQQNFFMYEYDITTPYDISTATYNFNNAGIDPPDGGNFGFTISVNGVHMLATSFSGQAVEYHVMSTPFDITTLSQVSAFDTAASGLPDPVNVEYGDSGNKMFVLDTSGVIHEYALNIPYDLSGGATKTGVTADVSTQGSGINGFQFIAGGLGLLVPSKANTSVHQFEMTAPYDLSTLIFSGASLNTFSESSRPGDVQFIDSANKLYVSDALDLSVYQYSVDIQVGTPVASITFPDTVEWEAGSEPDLVGVAGETNWYEFKTHDGGASWVGRGVYPFRPVSADTLDGQDGAYYLDFNNFTNVPDLYTSDDFNTDFDSKTTDDLTEGETNLYYSDQLVEAYLSGGTGVSFTNGEISIGQAVETNSDVEFESVTVTETTPVENANLTSKLYVDTVAQTLRTVPNAKAASVQDIGGTYVDSVITVPPTATLDIDGVTSWEVGDIALLKDQTNAAENGPYVITQIGDASTPWVLARPEFDNDPDEIPGSFKFINDGTENAGTAWVMVVDDPDTFTVGTDSITLQQFSGPGTYTAGDGINLSIEGVFSVDNGSNLEFDGDSKLTTTPVIGLEAAEFDTTAVIEPTPGQLAWDSDAGTLALGLNADVTAQLGQETHVQARATEAISNGDVVYASGAVGNSGKIDVSKFIADGSIPSNRVIGVATQDIASGEFGYITAFGKVRGLVTDGSSAGETWSEGDVLYASPVVAGGLTSTEPVAPNLDIPIAFVLSAASNNGTLFVRAYELGYRIGGLHDVAIDSPVEGAVLTYDATNDIWAPNTQGIRDPLPIAQTLENTSGTTQIDADAYNWHSVIPVGNTELDFTLTEQSEAKFDVVYKNSVRTGTYSISDASYTGQNLSTLTAGAVNGVSFKPDGTQFFGLAASNQSIYSYTLSTAWDITSGTADNNEFDVSGQESTPNSIAVRPDGSKVYVIGTDSGSVHQYTLSTPWDLSTIAYDNIAFDAATAVGAELFGIEFKPDGSKMWIADSFNVKVFEFDLTTPWDVSSAESNGFEYDASGEMSTMYDLAFNPDGRGMYLIDISGGTIHEYELMTPWEVSTARVTGLTFDPSSEDSTPVSITFRDDGTKMFLGGGVSGLIYEYDSVGQTGIRSVLTFADSVTWASRQPPIASGVDEIDWLEFQTNDGGTNWVGRIIYQDRGPVGSGSFEGGDDTVLDADLLDGQDSPYYLDYNNFTNTPELYDTSDFLNDFSSRTTDDLSEGTTNLYYADSLVDDHLTGGTGVTYDAGEISIGQAVGTTDDVQFNNLTLAGDLTVQGTTTTVNTVEVTIADNNILLNSDFTGANPTENSGITVNRGDLDNAIFQWNETNDHFELVVGATSLGRILTTDDLGAGSGLDADTLDGEEGTFYLDYNNFTNTPELYTTDDFNTDLGTKTTDDLAEGTTNLYYQDSLVEAYLTGGTGVDITDGVISIGQAVGTTDDLQFNIVTATNGFVGDVTGTVSDISNHGIADLSDVDPTEPLDQSYLIYDVADGLWKPSLVSTPTVSGLGDTTLTAIGENDLLIYDSGNSEWVNAKVTEEVISITADAQTEITFAEAPVQLIAVFRNGVRIRTSAVSVINTTGTYDPTQNGNSDLQSGDEIIVEYIA